MLDPSKRYIFKNIEVALTGEVAKNSSNTFMYQVKSIDSDLKFCQWVYERDLFVVSNKNLYGEKDLSETYHDDVYRELLSKVYEHGNKSDDRTGTGTVSLFGTRMEFDLSDGTVPLLTSKKIHIPSIIHEILWYLMGTGDITYLKDNGVRIWNEWAAENNIGPIYGPNWRNWENNIDQIADVIYQIKNNPFSRRLIVSAWNPNVLPVEDVSPTENVMMHRGALAPCHAFFQFYVNNGRLSCQLYQRSADMFLGVPFNIAQYSILTRMVAEVCDLEVDKFTWVGGDTHIYLNHFRQTKELLSRTPTPSPTLKFSRKIQNIDDFKYNDFVISNYHPHPTIKAAVSV